MAPQVHVGQSGGNPLDGERRWVQVQGGVGWSSWWHHEWGLMVTSWGSSWWGGSWWHHEGVCGDAMRGLRGLRGFEGFREGWGGWMGYPPHPGACIKTWAHVLFFIDLSGGKPPPPHTRAELVTRLTRQSWQFPIQQVAGHVGDNG